MSRELPTGDMSESRLVEQVNNAVKNLIGSSSYDSVVYVLKCKQRRKDAEIRELAKQKYSHELEWDDEDGVFNPPVDGEATEQQQEQLRENTERMKDMFEEMDVEMSDVIEKDRKNYEYPGWVDDALNSEEVYYVGWTNDLPQRIITHIAGDGDGADFTELFEPDKLIEIRQYDSQSKAKEAESVVANEYTKSIGEFEPDQMANKWAQYAYTF